MSLARVKIKKFSSTTLCSFGFVGLEESVYSAVRLWPAHIKHCSMSVTCDCHLDHLKTKCVYACACWRSLLQVYYYAETRDTPLSVSALHFDTDRNSTFRQRGNTHLHLKRRRTFHGDLSQWEYLQLKWSKLYWNSMFLILIGFYALGIHLKLLIRYYLSYFTQLT